jgi:dolichol kinase
MNEAIRQLVHIGFGAFVLLFYTLFGRTATIKGLFVATFVCILFMVARFLPHLSSLSQRLGRRRSLFARGAFSYTVGCLFLFCFTPPDFACGILCILAFGDGVCTLVGRWARIKLPWNKEKSLEGLVTFFLFGLFSAFFLGKSAIFYSLCLAFIESQRIRIDDNILIPLSAFILRALFKL